MSCVEVNDENRGVSSLGGKHSDLNEDIFAVGNPTGRPSILRQTENLPSNTVAKGTKVCFQTPRRDPLTKRILSPSKTSKMTNVDECVKLCEGQEKATEESPMPAKGSYNFDFDCIDAVNPFLTGGSKIPNSPACEQVRSKNKSEVSVLHAQLRREQVKVQSLEKNISQKGKEAEELAKLCDELISNVQKGGVSL
uniref:Transforming acidic coiled-coil-containing protein C-terminal domain-containing protein n=1 Tax=Neogobius melanostomus TaxID=47308 RepID=A0A8C6T480_9GOBI